MGFIVQIVFQFGMSESKPLEYMTDYANTFQRHARYYLALVQNSTENWRRIENNLDQIRRAWSWVYHHKDIQLIQNYLEALRIFQKKRGIWHEQIEWGRQALKSLPNDDILQRDILHNIAWCYYALGELKVAVEMLEKSRVQFPGGIATPEYASNLTALGAIYTDLGNRQKSIECYEQALKIRQSLEDHVGEAIILSNLGIVQNDLGNRQTALELLRMACKIHHDNGELELEATALNNLGAIHENLGQWEPS